MDGGRLQNQNGAIIRRISHYQLGRRSPRDVEEWETELTFCTAAAHFNYCSVDFEKMTPVLPPLTTMLVIQIDFNFSLG